MEFTGKQNALIRWAMRRSVDRADAIFWPGSIRSGKTVGSVAALILHGLMRRARGGPAAPYIMAGKSKLAVEMNHLPPVRMVAAHLGLPVKYARGRGELWVGPVDFRLVGGAQANSAEAIRGMTAAGAYLDEAVDLDEGFVMEAFGRCSAPGAIVIITTNKAGPGHWVKRRFYDSGDYAVMESTLEDNPNVGEGTRDFYNRTLTGHYAARMLANEWAGAGGLIYTRWSQADAATVAAQYGGPGRMVDVCVDWGTASVTAAALVMQSNADEHQWAIGREYYWDARLTGERTVGEHADAIVRMCEGRVTGDCVIDPSASALRLELRRRGMSVRRGNNDVAEGIAGLNGLFAAGRLVVSQECRETIRELLGYEWDERAAEAGEDKPVKRNDHAADAVRYWAQRRYRGGLDRILRWEALPAGLR